MCGDNKCTCTTDEDNQTPTTPAEETPSTEEEKPETPTE